MIRMSKPAAVAPQQAAFKTPGYAWVVLFALYLATLAAPLNLFKVPPAPVAGELFKNFQLTGSQFGMLMSIFSIMGFVLAIPAGFILKRFGIKIAGLIAVGAVTIGSVIGALAQAPSGTLLYSGRFIEGIGMGLIMVAAPFAISVWFPPNNRALPTGLWASCVGVGNVVTLIFAPMIMVSGGGAPDWHRVWWACAVFSAVAFVIFALLFRMPKKEEMYEVPAAPSAASREKPPSFGEAASNGSVWMIGIAFGCYNLVVMALCTFIPDYLTTVQHKAAYFDKGVMQCASFLTAFIMMASIFSGPAGGYLSDRLGKRKMVILIPYILMTLTFFFPFTTTGSQILTYLIVFGIVGGPLAPVLLASIPEVTKRPQLIGMGMSIGALCQNIGMFIGPWLFGYILDSFGKSRLDLTAHNYAIAGYWMIPFCVLGIIATCRIKVR
jgi:MFS family permease